MEQLSSVNKLTIGQKKEWGEILSGFETKNRYMVADGNGNPMYQVSEEAHSLLARIFLRAWRPFTMTVFKQGNQPVLSVKRPFRFYFHEAEVFDGQGQLIGSIKKRFSILRRVYSVFDPSGQEIYQLYGPLLHPWTFHIRNNGVDYGKITKKWSGLMKEGFTDADNFGIVFPTEWDIRLKALFLGTVFLIDFVHFENKGNN